MNITSSIIDGSIALFGLIAGLMALVLAVKANEPTAEATSGTVLSESRPSVKKAA